MTPYVRDNRADLARLFAGTLELLVEGVWIQGNMARNQHGCPVMPDDPEAACFCLIGAFRKVRKMLGLSWRVVWEAETAVQLKCSFVAVTFNDRVDTTLAEVHALLQELLNATKEPSC